MHAGKISVFVAKLHSLMNTWAAHTNILIVITAPDNTNPKMPAVSKPGFLSTALHIIQPNSSNTPPKISGYGTYSSKENGAIIKISNRRTKRRVTRD